MLKILLVLIPVALAPMSAFAADEMIVSTFRETGAERLPASVTVIDAATLQKTSVQHFEELIAQVPNLNFSGDGNRARYFQIRGIGELEQYQGAPNPSVGFIVDDIDLSGLGSAATLFDIDQVDVLRGPQGSRFGANALAGLIYVKSAEPTETFESRIEATAGSEDTWGLGGVVSGPAGDAAAYRVSLNQFKSDGFQRNVTLGRDDTNGYDELTGRAKLRVTLGEDWRLDLTGLYADIDNGYDAFAVDNNGSVTFSDKPGEDAQETVAGSLRVTGSLPAGMTFIGITGAAATDWTFSFDGDWGSDEFWDTPEFGNSIYDFFQSTDRERDTVSQEFRLLSGDDSRLLGVVDWLVGVYGLRLDEDLAQFDAFRDGVGCVQPCESNFASRYEADTLAVFGELGLPFATNWQLDLGLRVERWEAEYTDDNVRFSPDDELWGGHVNLGYQWTEAALLYGRIARGYKAGGFNLDPNTPADFVFFADESLLNYELGVKILAADGNVRADLAIYVMDRDDAQVRTSVQVTPGDPNSFFFLTDNAEDVRNLGLETSLDWQVLENWQLFGALGLQDTEIRSFPGAAALEGRSLAHAPAWNFQLGAEWQQQQGWFVRGDVTGMDEFLLRLQSQRKIFRPGPGQSAAGQGMGRMVRCVLGAQSLRRGLFGARILFRQRAAGFSGQAV